MNRFFIEESRRTEKMIWFDAEISHQITRVLRLQTGDRVECPNGEGQTYLVELTKIDAKQTEGAILETIKEYKEATLRLTLVQGLPKGERWEWILQKGTELGLYAFQPVLSERTIVRLSDQEFEKKKSRWQKIIQEAAEQSHREKCPVLNPLQTLEQWSRSIHTYDVVLFAYEGEREQSLATVLQQVPHLQHIALLVGPEGGFTEEEAGRLIAAGAKPVSLGPRIMRTETAALALTAIVMYHYGQMEVIS